MSGTGQFPKVGRRARRVDTLRPRSGRLSPPMSGGRGSLRQQLFRAVELDAALHLHELQASAGALGRRRPRQDRVTTLSSSRSRPHSLGVIAVRLVPSGCPTARTRVPLLGLLHDLHQLVQASGRHCPRRPAHQVRCPASCPCWVVAFLEPSPRPVRSVFAGGRGLKTSRGWASRITR